MKTDRTGAIFILLTFVQVVASVVWWHLGHLDTRDLYLPVEVFYFAPLSGPAAIFIHGHDFLPTFLWLLAVQVVLFAVAYAPAPGGKKTLNTEAKSISRRRRSVFLAAGFGWWALCGLLAVVLGV